MDVEERTELAGRLARRQRAVQALELALDLLHREREALDLRRDLPRGDRVVRDLERRVRDELRAPDGNPARDADAVERKAHHGRANPIATASPERDAAVREQVCAAAMQRGWIRPARRAPV